MSDSLEYALQCMRDMQRAQQGAWSYCSFYDYVLDRGHACKVEQMTHEEWNLASTILAIRMRPQGCFYNAQQTVLKDHSEKLVYVEGFAVCGFLPTHHGWITLNGKVLDPTWSRSGCIPDEENSYFGVEFSREEIKAARETRKKKGLWSIIDNWEAWWPEMKKPRLTPLPPSILPKEFG